MTTQSVKGIESIEELIKILLAMNDEERIEVLALIKGMKSGRDLANSRTSKPA